MDEAEVASSLRDLCKDIVLPLMYIPLQLYLTAVNLPVRHAGSQHAMKSDCTVYKVHCNLMYSQQHTLHAYVATMLDIIGTTLDVGATLSQCVYVVAGSHWSAPIRTHLIGFS